MKKYPNSLTAYKNEHPFSKKPFAILFIGREHIGKDSTLIPLLLDTISNSSHTIYLYSPPLSNALETYKIRAKTTQSRFKKKWYLLSALIQYPLSWKSLVFRHSLKFKYKHLLKTISYLESHYEHVTLISRSRGGILASKILNKSKKSALISLSYPFKSPEREEEAYRYEHLEQIKKPVLIIQGTKDEYGGKEILGKYKFSPTTKLQFLNTNHEFRLSQSDWNTLITQITTFLHERRT